MAKKDVAVQDEAGLPAEFLNEMALDAGAGSEEVTAKDLAIPFLRVLQKMSPQLSKREAEYIEGATDGDIINTVTGQLWACSDEKEPAKVTIIPVDFKFKVMEWWPRNSKLGSGLVKSYTRDEDLPAHERKENAEGKMKTMTDQGTELIDTAEHYVLIVHPDGTMEQALIVMSSTQLGSSRKWNSLIKQKMLSTANGPVPAPSFSHMYTLGTAYKSNDDGEWAVFTVADAGRVENIDIYRAAKAFNTSISSGTVVVKHTQEGTSTDVPF